MLQKRTYVLTVNTSYDFFSCLLRRPRYIKFWIYHMLLNYFSCILFSLVYCIYKQQTVPCLCLSCSRLHPPGQRPECGRESIERSRKKTGNRDRRVNEIKQNTPDNKLETQTDLRVNDIKQTNFKTCCAINIIKCSYDLHTVFLRKLTRKKRKKLRCLSNFFDQVT